MTAPEIVIVCQRGARVDSAIKYGALRATVEMARSLQQLGRDVLLVGLADAEEGDTDGVPFLGAADEAGVHDLLRGLGRLHVLVGCSRADVFVTAPADVPVIYHHGPHLPEGEFALPIIRRLGIPVVAVSAHSMERQKSWGVPGALLRLVRNGYEQQVFRLPEREERAAHRLIFAGMGVPYKGLDIAIAAFRLLRSEFHDAELEIFGSTDEWSDIERRSARRAEFVPESWRNPDDSVDWSRIVQETPGVNLHGAVDAERLARGLQGASLLVMPSRIEETFGLVSVEAQACGCLPVLPHRGGFPETMRPGVTGYTYQDNTPAKLAREVSRLWKSGLPQQEQRVTASEWAAHEFSWDHSARQFARLLDEPRKQTGRLWQVEASIWRAAARGKCHLRRLRDRSLGRERRPG